MRKPSTEPHGKTAGSQRRTRSSYRLPVLAPFRLDFTASALRRLLTNPVDVITAEGDYVHAVSGSRGPAVARVRQPAPTELEVTIDADPLDHEPHQHILPLIARTLGTARDLTSFYRSAATIPWLDPLALRLRGLKPPRYRTLWEALVNAVVYQQVSLHAASAVVLRIIQAFGTSLESDGTRVYLFPDADSVLGASDAALRGMGLSAGKLATLRRAADAMRSGALDSTAIEELPSSEAARLLQAIKGIGPWTASVILLRGFGRLDVFPMNDSGVARNLAMASGDGAIDVGRILEKLGEQKGMLYYHLLLARLEARGELGSASTLAR